MIVGTSEIFVPIPGFKSVAQAQENVGALCHGPLDNHHMRQIGQILGD